MCLAIPGKIVAIDGEMGDVDFGGVTRKANLSMVDANVGDWASWTRRTPRRPSGSGTRSSTATRPLSAERHGPGLGPGGPSLLLLNLAVLLLTDDVGALVGCDLLGVGFRLRLGLELLQGLLRVGPLDLPSAVRVRGYEICA